MFPEREMRICWERIRKRADGRPGADCLKKVEQYGSARYSARVSVFLRKFRWYRGTFFALGVYAPRAFFMERRTQWQKN